MDDISSTLQRVLTDPTPADLWQLQGELLAIGTEAALRARQVAGDFYLYLTDLESKVTSRHHSRWASALATASVTSVSLHELLEEQADVLKQLLLSGVPALLEIGSAIQSVRAWEVEAALVHHEAAWTLYGELWDISQTMLPDLPARQRQAHLDALLKPVMKLETPTEARFTVLVKLFQVVLAVRLAPVLAGETGVYASN